MIRNSLIATALLLSACATGDQTASNEARDCFFSSAVRGYSVIDAHRVNISVGANRNYILGTSWNARDLDWSNRIALRSSTGSICTGNGLGVEIIGGDPRQTFPVTSIERASEPAAPASS